MVSALTIGTEKLECARHMEAARQEANEKGYYLEIRRGRCFGAEDVVARMLDRIGRRLRKQANLEAGWGCRPSA